MRSWIEGIAGPQYFGAVLWTLAALVLLLVVLFAVRLIRSLSAGTFVSGGRNRKTRLSVMDATAVDSHRRLVLVRRDDVEHLLLIGGPTDVVVERDIRLAARRPVARAEGQHPLPQQHPRPAEPQQKARAAPASLQPAPTAQAAISRNHVPAPTPSPVPPSPTAARAPASREVAAAAHPKRDPLDEELEKGLQVTLDTASSLHAETQAKPASKAPAVSLDDEMAKLLGELTSERK